MTGVLWFILVLMLLILLFGADEDTPDLY